MRTLAVFVHMSARYQAVRFLVICSLVSFLKFWVWGSTDLEPGMARLPWITVFKQESEASMGLDLNLSGYLEDGSRLARLLNEVARVGNC
jgi:hypothetical protein